MDTKTLTVGQKVDIYGGYAPDEGEVVKIEPPLAYINTNGWGLLLFNDDGEECNPDGTASEGHYLPQFLLPFKLKLQAGFGQKFVGDKTWTQRH